MAKLSKIEQLICSCCGKNTRGRQWWNRDTGYGLCSNCVEFCKQGITNEEFEQTYGKQGIHFDIEGKQ